MSAETEEDATILGKNQLNMTSDRLHRRAAQGTSRPALAGLVASDGAQQNKRNKRRL